MGENKYVLVALALDATWKQAAYTYTASEQLASGTVVTVPFGKSERLGVVISKTAKPKGVAVKPVTRALDIQLPKQSLDLYRSLQAMYPNMPGAFLQHMLPSYLKTKHKETDKQSTMQQRKLVSLTDQQQTAVDRIQSSQSKTNVLHGITGSGKTHVFAALAQDAMNNGKHALLLYPEISLTTQLFTRLGELLGSENIVAFHSKMTPKELRTAWRQVHDATDPLLIIGPRSALFLPFKHLGCVLIDEAHDSSFKQDSATRYNGLVVAALLRKTHDATLLLGSATPPTQETFQITQKGGSVISMTELALDTSSERDIQIVDMKKHASSSLYLLSEPLLESVEAALQSKKQSLLFLNKRGTARIYMCEQCGWHAECPRCETPLTFHHDSHTLVCHLCGFSGPAQSVCPDCSSDIKTRSLGTKALVEELQKRFPSATIMRFDSDNKKSDSFQNNYDSIVKGDVDILVGTQLLTKGLDLPKLSVVGVLQADNALYLPDFASRERTFQQLLQVSGRVGRGHASGSVLIQTYQPDNELLSYVLNNDWQGFYVSELKQRKPQNFPPYSYIMKIIAVKTSAKTAENALKRVISSVKSSSIMLKGPSPNFYEKQNNKYYWHLIAFSSSRKELVALAEKLPKDVIYDLDPVSSL